MCRKHYLYGWSLICLGLGILVGNSLEWLTCCVSGAVLLGLGFCVLRQK